VTRLALARVSRLPPNVFSIPFGIAGLASVWRLMTAIYGSPEAVADALYLAAAAILLALLWGALVRAARRPGQILAELRDPVCSPFWSLPAITGILLTVGLEPHAHDLAKVLFTVFFVVTLLFAGWIGGEWIVGDLDAVQFHPGFVLPAVAGGFIGAEGAGVFGMEGLGWLSFGIGLVSWMVLSSLTFNRLYLGPKLPAALVPTLVITIAPSAVGGVAYFQLHGLAVDTLAYVFAGYTVLMALVQVRLLPLYRSLEFGPGIWAFAFCWAAVTALGLRWLQIEDPPHASLYAGLGAGAVSLLVAAIAARTVAAVVRREARPA
jgi:tellurite resistance protein